MASVVRAVCGSCGVQSFPPEASRIVVTTQQHTILSFQCPGCGKRRTQRLVPAQVIMLRDIGVELTYSTTFPDEAKDARRGAPGVPPLSEDDLIEFGSVLEQLPDDAVLDVLAGEGSL